VNAVAHMTRLPARPITIRVRVAQYLERALVNHFENGRFEVFDATTLTVVAPHGMAGRELKIFHHRRAAADSLWRDVGRELTVSLDARKLERGARLFTAAVTIVESDAAV